MRHTCYTLVTLPFPTLMLHIYYTFGYILTSQTLTTPLIIKNAPHLPYLGYTMLHVCYTFSFPSLHACCPDSFDPTLTHAYFQFPKASPKHHPSSLLPQHHPLHFPFPRSFEDSSPKDLLREDLDPLLRIGAMARCLSGGRELNMMHVRHRLHDHIISKCHALVLICPRLHPTKWYDESHLTRRSSCDQINNKPWVTIRPAYTQWQSQSQSRLNMMYVKPYRV